MQLIDELKAEHLLVDRVAGALIRFAEEASSGGIEPEYIEDFVTFFRVFVAGYHHQREEDSLFAVLVARAEISADRGPLAVMKADHRAAAAMVDELATAKYEADEAAGIARCLAHHFWEHVDKEDSVLFPESVDRLRRNGVVRLAGRGPTVKEEATRDLGEGLTERFPPLDDPEIVRGDGCIACSAFGDTCSGIESEWWTSWERQHYRSLDDG
jgi:hemerythrin-like domain-containing protein